MKTSQRTVPQGVFNSPEALRAARQGHAEACAELAATSRHKLDVGNPNHPDYDLKLFGYAVNEFLAKQSCGANGQ